jgi:PilZ domain-containing protein
MSDATSAPPQDTENEEGELTDRPKRARVFKKGKMVFQNGLRSLPCMVRNVSEGGAMLEFETAFLLPQEFNLYIDLEDYEVTCERRWEKGLRCGVEFISEKRHKSAQRAQVLKTSEEALKKDTDNRQESPDSFFSRRKEEDTRRTVEPVNTARSTRATSGGKQGFGKRR